MSRLRSLLAPLILLVALLGAPPAAAAERGSTISGTVTSEDGGPLTQWIQVAAQQGSYNANWIGYADAQTGEYSIDALPPGSYIVHFRPVVTDLWAKPYRDQMYDGVYVESEATRIVITADGQSFTGIDAVMEFLPPEDPTASLPCVNPRDRAAVNDLVWQFRASGGTVANLTRAQVTAYLARCR